MMSMLGFIFGFLFVFTMSLIMQFLFWEWSVEVLYFTVRFSIIGGIVGAVIIWLKKGSTYDSRRI
jgi:hypothetical protein